MFVDRLDLISVLQNFKSVSFFQFRIKARSVLSTSLIEGGKAYLAYVDFIKDFIFIYVLMQALGGLAELLTSAQSHWSLGNTVSSTFHQNYI